MRLTYISDEHCENAAACMSKTAETENTRVALLHRISGVANSNLDIDSILREMVVMTRNATRADSTLVYLIDEATNEIVLRASDPPHDPEIGNVRLKMGEGVTGWVASYKSVIALSRDASLDSRFKSFTSLQEDTFQAFLSVPMIDSGGVLGVINVHHREAHEHSQEEVALVTFIGEQMRSVITRARLSARSQSVGLRMGTLAAVAQAIGGNDYIDRILQAIAELLAKTLDSAVCSILLVDDVRRELTVRAARCSAPDYLNRMPIDLEGSLMEHVVRQGSPAIVPNIRDEKRYRYPELARLSGLSTLLVTPLMSQGRIIGTINVYTSDPRTFADAEIGFVQVVAGQAAIAVQNAHLMAETLEMKRALEARKLTDRAKGILQYKHNFTEEEAHLRLREESRRLGRSMRDLAEAIVLADDLNRTRAPKKTRERDDDHAVSVKPRAAARATTEREQTAADHPPITKD